MLVLEFLGVSVVGGTILAGCLILWDRWRDSILARKLEEVNKEE